MRSDRSWRGRTYVVPLFRPDGGGKHDGRGRHGRHWRTCKRDRGEKRAELIIAVTREQCPPKHPISPSRLPLPILLIREPLLLLPSSSSRPLPPPCFFPSGAAVVVPFGFYDRLRPLLSPLAISLSSFSLFPLSLFFLSLHCYPSRLLSLPLCPPAKKISSSPSFRLSIPLSSAFLPALPLSSVAFNFSNKKTDGGGGGGFTSPASHFPLPMAPLSLCCRLSQPESPHSPYNSIEKG